MIKESRRSCFPICFLIFLCGGGGGFGLYLMVIRAYVLLCIQGSLLAGLKVMYWVPEMERKHPSYCTIFLHFDYFLFKRERGKQKIVWELFLLFSGHSFIYRKRFFCLAFKLVLSCKKCTLISYFLLAFFWG